MKSKADLFIDKVLGEDFLESLTKFELWKPGTKTVVDHEEIKTALMIVPRTIMAILIKELVPMAVDENKCFELAIGNNVKVNVTKHERDVYTGTVEEDNKVVVDFKNRSVPGLGLVIMSAFELYDSEHLFNSPEKEKKEGADDELNKLIDERINLHRAKEKNKGTSKLHNFIETQKSKIKKSEFTIQLAKGEQVDCPDCGKHIFNESAFSGCICLGDDMDKKIFMKKAESGVKIRFGRGWDKENIELLLELLRRKRE